MEHHIRLILLTGMDGTGILFEPLLNFIPHNVECEVYPLQKFESHSPVEQAHELANYLGNEEVIIFAESFSGLIAYELCKLKVTNIKHIIFAAAFLERPSFLSKLSFLLPLNIIRKKLIPAALLSYLLFGSFQRPELVHLFYKSFNEVSNRTLRSRLHIISTFSNVTTNIEIPATYIRAKKDFLVSKNCIQKFEKVFKHLNIIHLDGGHFIAQSNAKECWLSIERQL